MSYGSGQNRQSRREEDRGNENRDRDAGRSREGAQIRPKTVYALSERGEKTYWTRIGVAYVNRDGSITARLDALPVSGTLQIREGELRGEGE